MACLTDRSGMTSMMHMHHDSAVTPDQELACACTALRKASRAVTRLYDEMMDTTGMSIIQFSVLRNIARHEPLPLMQLAGLLVMDRTTLYRALKPLEKNGWVAIGEGSGRAKSARLTGAGRKALAGATGRWRAAQSRFLGRIGSREWAGIEASLARLVAVADECSP